MTFHKSKDVCPSDKLIGLVEYLSHCDKHPNKNESSKGGRIKGRTFSYSRSRIGKNSTFSGRQKPSVLEASSYKPGPYVKESTHHMEKVEKKEGGELGKVTEG